MGSPGKLSKPRTRLATAAVWQMRGPLSVIGLTERRGVDGAGELSPARQSVRRWLVGCTRWDMASVRISLCMIVRDEAAMIDDCLASVKGLVSEVIVVDTGSRDDTRERARRAGAKVFEVTWRDDFAWARNQSLAHATGDWVLILDADERLVPCDFKSIRRMLAGTTADCVMLRLHDADSLTASTADVLSGKRRQGDLQRIPRLARRKPDLAYVGVIHEDLGPWVVKHGRKVATMDVDVVHYGATKEIYAGRGKFERNVRLLTELARNTPEDPTALGYLAHQYLGNEKLAEARQAADEGWRRLRFVEASPDYRRSVLRLAQARVQLQLKAGDAQGALETAKRARRIEGRHYDLDYISGYALEALGTFERNPETRRRLLLAARACFETCIASRGHVYLQAFIEGATGWAAWNRLGVIGLLLGEASVARDAFRRVLEQKPDLPEARLGLLEATLGLGMADEALGMVGSLLEDPRLRAMPDLWVLAASACEARGAIDDMAEFLGHARAAKSEYFTSHRRLLHAERVAGLALYRGKPVGGPGLVGLIGALVARTAVSPADVGAWPSALPVVRMVVQNLARCGQLAHVEPLLEPRAGVIVPGLTEHVRQAAAEQGLALVYEAPPDAVVVCGPDASFVVAMLSAHPRLRGRVQVGRAEDGQAARLVLAGEAPAPRPDAVAQVTRVDMLADPLTQCDRLLAALGEGDAGPLVRHIVEAIPREAPRARPSSLRHRRTSPSSMSP
jgi:glycosyltransferase involved in cell wall biosynthesis